MFIVKTKNLMNFITTKDINLSPMTPMIKSNAISVYLETMSCFNNQNYLFNLSITIELFETKREFLIIKLI